MPSPFPGMDPYLEDKDIWPSFHNRLAVELSDQLNPHIGPRYYSDVDIRTIEGSIEVGTDIVIYPDVGVYEPFTPPGEPSVLAEGTAASVIAPAPVHCVAYTPERTKTVCGSHLSDGDKQAGYLYRDFVAVQQTARTRAKRISGQACAHFEIARPSGRD